MKHILIYALFLLSFLSCKNDKKTKEYEPVTTVNKYAELDKQARQLFGTLDTVADNPNNPITEEKIALGKALYFDKRLSKDNTQSCNTCHNLSTYGVDNKPLSPGNNGGLGTRNSPTTLNAALHMAQFWDGREPDVEAQAGGPITNPVEMEMHDEKAVVRKLSKIEDYQQLFAKAFSKDKKPITYANLKKSIGVFERTLITPSRFDKYIAGDDNALSNPQKKGLQTFINSGCVTCHSGKLLGGQMYQKFGLFGNYWEHTGSKTVDEGRYDVTKSEVDKYMFKVPSLRNVEKTYPYFHDGSVEKLGDAVKIMAKLQSNKDLTESEIVQIVVFLNALTGEVPHDLQELARKSG